MIFAETKKMIGLTVFVLLCNISSLQGQNNQIVKGTVTDVETGDVIPGVNILVKGMTIGTSTDAEGNFEFNAPSLQDTLIVSFVGYQTREVPIDGRTTLEGSRNPLTVLDGVIYTGKITDLNPNSIKSVNVLKGPSSKAIYGAQAKLFPIQLKKPYSK